MGRICGRKLANKKKVGKVYGKGMKGIFFFIARFFFGYFADYTNFFSRLQTSGSKDGYDMNVQSAWKRGYTGKGIVVSILDDGIQTNHPDLIHNYVSNPFTCFLVVFP